MRQAVERFGFRMLLLVTAMLPFELPVTEGLHGTLKPFIGDAYMLFFCGTWIIVVPAIYLCWQDRPLRKGWQQFSLYGLTFLVPGLLAVVVSAMAFTGDLQLSLQQLVFGYIAPLLWCFALFAMTEEQQRRVWLAFYAGWCVFLAGSFIFLATAWQNTETLFAGLNLGQKLFLWRGTFYESWNLYPIYMGNANKESNYILIFLLFSSVLIGKDAVKRPGVARKVYFAYWTLGVFTLLLLFSRAALLLLPVAVIASGFWTALGQKMKWTLVTSAVAIASVGYASFSSALAYLFTAKTFFQPNVDVLGTFNQRFEQWDEIYQFLGDRPSVLFTGVGTGGYGTLFYGDEIRGTHNMFLDTLLESGLLSLAALVLVMLLVTLACIDLKTLRIRDRTSLIGLAVLTMLMFREHSVSFLYVTSLGGICFAVIFYMTALRPPVSPVVEGG